MYCTYLQLTSIELSPLQLSVLLVYVFQTRNIYSHFIDGEDIFIGSSISCFINRNFFFSATTNVFFGPHISSYDLTYFFISQVIHVCGIRHDGDFHHLLESSCNQKEIRNLIFSSLFLVLLQLLSSCAGNKTSLLRIEKIGILERQLVSYRRRCYFDAQGEH